MKATAGQPPFFDKGHVGTVVRNCTDGTTLVHFDDGQGVLFSKVDVGALPEPEGEMKWTRSAGVCIQPEPGYTAEQMREYRLSGGVSADALRQYISGLRLVQKVNENDGTERSNGKAFAFGVVANELAALIGKEA